VLPLVRSGLSVPFGDQARSVYAYGPGLANTEINGEAPFQACFVRSISSFGRASITEYPERGATP